MDYTQPDRFIKINYTEALLTSKITLIYITLNVYINKNNIGNEIIEQVEIHLKYAGYIAKEKSNTDKLNRLENVPIPSNFDYTKVKSLSYEAREKLSKTQPTSISKAGRISGVSPSNISALLVYIGRQQLKPIQLTKTFHVERLFYYKHILIVNPLKNLKRST